jgi:hypothetical protein
MIVMSTAVMGHPGFFFIMLHGQDRPHRPRDVLLWFGFQVFWERSAARIVPPTALATRPAPSTPRLVIGDPAAGIEVELAAGVEQ